METNKCEYLDEVLEKVPDDMSLLEYLERVEDRSVATGFTMHTLLCRSCARRAYELVNKAPLSNGHRSS